MLTCAADTPNYDVAPGASAALRNFELPGNLGFGLVAAPVMFSAEWSNGTRSVRLDARSETAIDVRRARRPPGTHGGAGSLPRTVVVA